MLEVQLSLRLMFQDTACISTITQNHARVVAYENVLLKKRVGKNYNNTNNKINKI